MSQVLEQIKNDISTNDVVIYMKGSALLPRCGFSAAVVSIFQNLGVAFKSVDVLEDPEMRQGIKDFTDWPTLPQVYVKGEFIGGCDIVREMHQAGELQNLLRAKGLLSA